MNLDDLDPKKLYNLLIEESGVVVVVDISDAGLDQKVDNLDPKGGYAGKPEKTKYKLVDANAGTTSSTSITVVDILDLDDNLIMNNESQYGVDPASNHRNDSPGSLPVPDLFRGCRDSCNKKTGVRPEPQFDPEKSVASNAAANTTKTTPVKLFNSSPILKTWSYHQRTVHSISATSVLDII